MIVQKEFLNKLKDFGLNTYESKLWAALLSRGVSTAGELSDIANVPRSRSYDVLESLERKGFIVMKLGKPIKYVAVSPEEVLERLKKKTKEESEKQIKIINSLKDSEVLQELAMLHKQGVELVEPTEITGSLKGRNNLYNHIEFMIKNAEKTITIVTSKAGLLRKVESFKNALEKAKKKGVKIRIGAPISKENNDAKKELSKLAEVKNIANIKARFVVVDNNQITFMLLDDKEVHPSYDVGVWVNTPLFAGALESMFDHIWKGS